MTHTERSTDRIDELSPSADRHADSTRALVDQTRRVTEQLQASLSALAMIDQAIGILISRGAAALRKPTRRSGPSAACTTPI